MAGIVAAVVFSAFIGFLATHPKFVPTCTYNGRFGATACYWPRL